jgi:hypothetical protein
MHCLIIKQPYLDQILSGEKTAEYRSTPTNIRGRIGLIASGGKGLVLGTVELYECDFSGWHGCFAWYLRKPRRLAQPIQIEQRPGCVKWVCAPHIEGLE